MGDEVTPDRRKDTAKRGRFDRFVRTVYALLGLIFLLLFAAGIAQVVVFARLGDRTNEAAQLSKRTADLAEQNRQLAERVARQTKEIQRQRSDNIRESCRETNHRNRIAYVFLKSIPPQPGQQQRSPAEQERLLRGFTDALVGPVRDCEARVRQLIP